MIVRLMFPRTRTVSHDSAGSELWRLYAGLYKQHHTNKYVDLRSHIPRVLHDGKTLDLHFHDQSTMGRPSYFRPLLATFDLHEDQFYDLMWSIECRDSHTENLFESFYAQLNDSKVSQDCIDLVETIKDRLPFQAPDFSRPDLPADAEYWAQVRAMREAAPELADFVDIWVPQGPGGDPLYYRIADKVNEV